MKNLLAVTNEWNRKRRECRVIIETPKGRRSKFDYDPNTRLFALGGLLPEGLAFPFDFGFVPSTLGGDGDPLDVMVLMDEPAHVGCVLQVRLIGVIEAEQLEDGKTVRNDRLLAVATHSYSHEDVLSLDQAPGSLLDQIEAFFVSYNKSRGKKFRIRARHGPKRAARVLETGMEAFAKKQRQQS
jgi:inorganic pyrophosphatase